MLTVSDADEDVVTAITNGADGYLLKDMDPELLLDQIQRAIEGKMVLSEAITEVKVHVKHLLKKLGLRSRVEAAVWMVNQDQ